MKSILMTLGALLFCSQATQALAGKPDWVAAKQSTSNTVSVHQVAETGHANGLFSEREGRLIRDYYRDHPPESVTPSQGKALPKGLRKKLERGGSLPPGWQKKLARGEVLDPELRAVSQPLPEELIYDLPGASDATEIIRIQDKVVRVMRGEGTVVDVIDLADILIGNGPDR